VHPIYHCGVSSQRQLQTLGKHCYRMSIGVIQFFLTQFLIHWNLHYPFPTACPFKSARELSVQLPANDSGRIGIFIDDSISIAPAIYDIPTRVVRAIPLAIRTLARPASNQDVVPRKDIISIKKLQAEGWLEETKTILGWVIKTRSLLISLPDHKLHAWVQDIDAMFSSQKCSHKSLEALLGRLNHVACTFLPMRHFLGRLYRALYRIKDKLGWTKLFSTELEDLALHKNFLRYANAGVSLNVIVFHKPTHMFRSALVRSGGLQHFIRECLALGNSHQASITDLNQLSRIYSLRCIHLD
jgi:hypothetical protein